MAVTALDIFYPFDAGAGAASGEDRWRKMARQWLASGPLVGVGNQMAVTGDSTGMQVKVASGAVWLNGHYGESSGVKTLPITSNSAGNPRIDLVVARLNTAGNTIGVDVIVGTPGATPVPPALTQNDSTWEIPLGQVVVGNGVSTITALNVTNVAAKTLVGSANGRSWNVPWGRVAISKMVTVSQGFIGASWTDLTDMNCTFTAVAGRQYRASVICETYGTHVPGFVQTLILANGTPLRLSTFAIHMANTQVESNSQAEFTGTGTTTVKVQLENDPTVGTVAAMWGSAAAPSYVYVEDIGPA